MSTASRWILAALCTLAFLSLAQAAGDSAASLEAAIEAARKAQVDALAPSGFGAALGAYERALKDRERGRNPERVDAHLQAGAAALRGASQAAASARESFSGVVKARDDALLAQAPKHAPEAWKKASERFAQAMEANEAADARAAQRRAAEAEVLLRDVELVAIKREMLGEARALIARAEAAKVGRFAPRSLQNSMRLIADADREIQRNRYEIGLPERLAAESSYEASHALHLAELIEGVLRQEKDDQAGVEALILAWEEPLKRMAADMELSVQFDRGFQPVLKELGERTRQQAQEIRRLKLEIEDRDMRLASLNTQMQRLDARLGGVSEERIALQRRVDAQERLRSDVAAIRSSFTSEEARIERRGDDVVLSLLGIRFAPGRSVINPDSAALMQKAQAALERFRGASIVIEGHTDANGGDSANLILSQDRADAVKRYFVTQAALDPEKISSIGYGEARPVATNETAAGRARNRRIDLVIRPDAAR